MIYGGRDYLPTCLNLNQYELGLYSDIDIIVLDTYTYTYCRPQKYC